MYLFHPFCLSFVSSYSIFFLFFCCYLGWDHITVNIGDGNEVCFLIPLFYVVLSKFNIWRYIFNSFPLNAMKDKRWCWIGIECAVDSVECYHRKTNWMRMIGQLSEYESACRSLLGKWHCFFFAFLLKILFYFCMGITRKRETRGRVRVKSIDRELPNCVREKTRFYYTQSSWGKKYWISIATHRYFECNFPLLFREGMKYRSESSFVYNRIIEKGRWRNG